MVCPYLTCANNNNSTIQRKDFESCPPQCWSRRKHWEMSGQTPEMEKNHVPPSRRLLQISVQKDIELIGTVSKRYKSCWLLTLTPATFSEGWWLLRPWSSARLRSLKNDFFYSKLVNYVPWLGRQPLHHDPAWPWWGHRDETRGRHRAVDLGTAATFIIRNNILVQTWELPKITCTSNSTMSAPWSMAYCMLANVFSLTWEQCWPLKLKV